MGKSAIEWLKRPGAVPYSWNVVRGCTRASRGCEHCYARRMHERFAESRGWGPFHEVTTLPHKLDELDRKTKPHTVFVCSMSDLFHEQVDYNFIDDVFAAMRRNPRHTHILLTKRPDRALRWWSRHIVTHAEVPSPLWPDNVWFGVTAEDQQAADYRCIYLDDIPAPIKFVSVEPMIGPVDLHRFMDEISWVIVGGESGARGRPMEEDWVRSLRADCIETSTPFFYKQIVRAGKKEVMPPLDGVVWNQFPT